MPFGKQPPMSLYKKVKLNDKGSFVHIPKTTYYEREMEKLDSEGVPFTSPRYQSVYSDYKQAKSDLEEWTSTGHLKDL